MFKFKIEGTETKELLEIMRGQSTKSELISEMDCPSCGSKDYITNLMVHTRYDGTHFEHHTVNCSTCGFYWTVK